MNKKRPRRPPPILGIVLIAALIFYALLAIWGLT